uniref:Non-lysosomal glucosylceramidase n=1 Tax=Clastoptera arizonana TaxID=38151 RepID=A0A1B6DSU6_9HEMI
MDSKITGVPLFGWSAKLNHTFPEKWTQRIKPTIKQAVRLVPLFIRYVVYCFWLFLKGRQYVMLFFNPETSRQWSGVPLGGIGGGTIGRSYKGQFCNYQMIPGIYEYNVVYANQFIVTIQDEKNETIYQKVISTQSKPKDSCLNAWSWDFPSDQAYYTALYPRAWTVYDIPEHKVRLICRQISPVIPNNYKDSCLPGCAFIWSIENNNEEALNVSITFTFKNGTGGKNDKKEGCWSEKFIQEDFNVFAEGVLIHQEIKNMACTYAICANRKDTVSVSSMTSFDPKGTGKILWDQLWNYGQLQSTETKSKETASGQELACAVCAKVQAKTNETSDIEFTLVWDMPVIKFSSKTRNFTRYYTQYFGKDGNAGPKMSAYVLANYSNWEQLIWEWQQPTLNDIGLPGWYKSAIFNETYYVANGGTMWILTDETEKLPKTDPRLEYGKFAYLEGHEYRMYNTYDVHFYASFALVQLWPKLQASIQYDFRDAILKVDTSKFWYLYDGKVSVRKAINSVPHDLGDPGELPYDKINAYNIHDISEWRDLNLKFVLQCYRDYVLTQDKQYLGDMWLQLTLVMDKALTWDKDGDGMIENDGSPDQTYDCWTMTGTSAYCGSLWLACLCCMKNVAKILNHPDLEIKYRDLLKRANKAFHTKLWNGQYYNFDCSTGSHSASIMSDQLCGLWYLHACEIDEEVFPKANVDSALQTIYDMNVKKFCAGQMGAVNGMMPSGKVDTYAIQSEEVWTGVVYGLAALMMHEGKFNEAFNTAQGIYETVYNLSGLGFATPEALHSRKVFRSLGYMRPLSIWAMQLAWQKRLK